MYIYLCICIYIYIYRERARETNRAVNTPIRYLYMHTCIYIYTYLYMYIHIYIFLVLQKCCERFFNISFKSFLAHFFCICCQFFFRFLAVSFTNVSFPFPPFLFRFHRFHCFFTISLPFLVRSSPVFHNFFTVSFPFPPFPFPFLYRFHNHFFSIPSQTKTC